MKKIHWIILGVLLVITLGFEFTVLADYDSHWWNAVPAFYALWGFLSCLAIIYVAKFISNNLVKRDPDYYDR